jgi:hypothetical protein
MLKRFSAILLFLLASSCFRLIENAKTETVCSSQKPMDESESVLVLLVDAKHLNYSNSQKLLQSLAKNPESFSKNGSFGHAWIYVRGIIDGHCVEVEGGHSGERGILDPKYFDGIMNYIEYGQANPTKERVEKIYDEPDPIKYLWAPLHDGFYQKGSGGHEPTFAAKIDITNEQFKKIIDFINPANYDYANYSLTHHQCTSFVAQVAALIGVNLPYEITVPVQQHVRFGLTKYQLWTDPFYSKLTIPSPDVLEKSLIQLVIDGHAEDALDRYLRYCRDKLRKQGCQ